MQVVKCFVAAVLLAGGFACKPHSSLEVRAHIVERRVENDGRLLVRYLFKKSGTLVIDSAEFGRETVIPHDSVPVIFSTQNPSEHKLQVP